jgi:hypothetical protein
VAIRIQGEEDVVHGMVGCVDVKEVVWFAAMVSTVHLVNVVVDTCVAVSHIAHISRADQSKRGVA